MPKFEQYRGLASIDAEARKSALALRYWVFANQRYYPSGGLQDLIGTTDDPGEARTMVGRFDHENYAAEWHVYDSLTGELAEGEAETC